METELRAIDPRIEEIRKIEAEGQVILDLILMRHGPKATASGEKNELADDFNTAVDKASQKIAPQTEGRLTHINTSPIPRAVNTAERVNKKMQETGEEVWLGNTINELNTPLELKSADLAILLQIQSTIEPKKRDLAAKESSDPKEIEQITREKIDREVLSQIFNGMMEAYIDDLNLWNGLEIDNNFTTSTQDLAAGIEKRISDLQRHLGLLKGGQFSDGKAPYLNVEISHSFPIMAYLRKNLVFLKNDELIEAKEMEVEDFWAETGGVIVETGQIGFRFLEKDGKILIKVTGDNFEGYIMESIQRGKDES